MKAPQAAGRAGLFALIGAALVVGTWLAQRDGSSTVVELADGIAGRGATPRADRAAPASAPTSAPVNNASVAPRIALGEPNQDPFSPHDWMPPPPPVPAFAVAVLAPAAPAVPVAPPLPFTMLGTIDSGAGTFKAFLSQRDALLVAAVGDVIDKDYRVESIAPSAVVFTFLPLQATQTVRPTGPQP